MKNKNFLILLLMVLSTTVFSQNQIKYEFKYDGAGNRTQRKIVEIAPPPAQTAVAANQTTDTTASAPQNYFPPIEEGIVGDAFPNPTYGLVNVVLNDASNASYQLFDLGGKVVAQGIFTSLQNTLDLSEQAPGQYILIITSSGKSKDFKIIKKS